MDLVDGTDDRIAVFRRRFPDTRIDLSAPGSAMARAGPMLESVLDNVIENAIEYHDRDRSNNALSIERTRFTRELVTLKVVDDGPDDRRNGTPFPRIGGGNQPQSRKWPRTVAVDMGDREGWWRVFGLAGDPRGNRPSPQASSRR